MNSSQNFELDRTKSILMQICTEDPQESAEQLFLLNRTEVTNPETLHFLAKITRLKKGFHQLNHDCITRERHRPSTNLFSLDISLEANLVILKRGIMHLAKELQQNKLIIKVLEQTSV